MQKTLFGYPVVEVEMKDMEEVKIVLGSPLVGGGMSNKTYWKLRIAITARLLTKRAVDRLWRWYAQVSS